MSITNNDKQIKHKDENNVHEYFSYLSDKVAKNLQSEKHLEKIENECHIPTFEESNFLQRYKYTLPQLKAIAKTYKLKVSGNKNQLLTRIYSYLYFSSFIIKIQKVCNVIKII